MIKEIVYIGRDNSIDLQLISDGVAVDLAGVTKMHLKAADGAFLVDSAVTPQCFDWTAGDGTVIISLGDQDIPPLSYTCYLIVFDVVNTDGVVWDTVKITFKSID